MTILHRTLGNEEFANVLFAIITQYNKSDYRQDPVNKKLKESAFQLIRKWTDLNDPLLYSKAAMKLLKDVNVKSSLCMKKNETETNHELILKLCSCDAKTGNYPLKKRKEIKS